MEGYKVVDVGTLSEWGEFLGGFTPENSYLGRRVLEQELPLTFFGVTVNSSEPGASIDYWHSHSIKDELYFFLDGEGEMGLDDEVVPVKAGSAVWVGQGVMRTWRCRPNSPTALKWLCIRAGGAPLEEISGEHGDWTMVPATERPLPWQSHAGH